MTQFGEGIFLHEKVELIFATHGPRSHFFGYYDKSPLDLDERRLLCHAVHFDGRIVKDRDEAEIGYWDIDTGDYMPLVKTGVFNWQQGAMLQWLPGSNDSKIIYNDRLNNQFAGVIYNLQFEKKQILPTTIYSLTPDGRYAITPRFERLHCTHPGYSYQGLNCDRWAGQLPDKDGILRMDLQKGTNELILETAAIAENKAVSSMKGAVHYVASVMVNPSGKEFIFMHRWKTTDEQALTRLYRCSIDGSKLYLYPDSGRYSHANWLNDEKFIVWGRPINPYARLRRSKRATKWLLRPFLLLWRRHDNIQLLRTVAQTINQDSFLLFSDNQQPPQIVNPKMLQGDGHPSFSPANQSLLLTDTYEDPQNYRHLILYNLNTDETIELGRFYSPPQFNQTGFRCDLHPRWSPSGCMVSIDTIVGERRQMLVLDVSKVVETSSE